MCSPTTATEHWISDSQSEGVIARSQHIGLEGQRLRVCETSEHIRTTENECRVIDTSPLLQQLRHRCCRLSDDETGETELISWIEIDRWILHRDEWSG